MRYLISLPNTPATRNSVMYETSSKSFQKSSGKPYCNWKFWNETWRSHDTCFDIKLSPFGWQPEFPALFIFTSLFSAVRKWHTGARPVASRHVTSRHARSNTSRAREREGGATKKKKKPTEKHQQHEPLPASGATAQAADMLGSSVTLGNTRPDSWRWDHGAGHARLPLIYLESECWEVKEGGGAQSSTQTLPRH